MDSVILCKLSRAVFAEGNQPMLLRPALKASKSHQISTKNKEKNLSNVISNII